MLFPARLLSAETHTHPFPTSTTHLESVESNLQTTVYFSGRNMSSADCFIFCPQLADGRGSHLFSLTYSMTLCVLMPYSNFLFRSSAFVSLDEKNQHQYVFSKICSEIRKVSDLYSQTGRAKRSKSLSTFFKCTKYTNVFFETS